MNTLLSELIKIPKKDKKNLLTGMKYSSFVCWSGFFVPDFPENGICDIQSVRTETIELILNRISTEKNLLDFISLSVSEAISDNVKMLEAFIPESFEAKVAEISGNNLESVLEFIKTKFESKIKIEFIFEKVEPNFFCGAICPPFEKDFSTESCLEIQKKLNPGEKVEIVSAESLFSGKSLSEFCVNLYESKILTKEEIFGAIEV